MKKIFIIIFLSLYGCKPIEPVDFVEINNVLIKNSKNNELNISADIVLNNPNKTNITITKIDVEIYAEEILIVKINEQSPRELLNLAESTINVNGEVDIKNLEKFINKKGLAIILGNEDVGLHFKGEIEAKAYGIKDVINIDYSIKSVKGLIN
jgi:LEA14-like dessication related protein